MRVLHIHTWAQSERFMQSSLEISSTSFALYSSCSIYLISCNYFKGKVKKLLVVWLSFFLKRKMAKMLLWLLAFQDIAFQECLEYEKEQDRGSSHIRPAICLRIVAILFNSMSYVCRSKLWNAGETSPSMGALERSRKSKWSVEIFPKARSVKLELTELSSLAVLSD